MQQLEGRRATPPFVNMNELRWGEKSGHFELVLWMVVHFWLVLWMVVHCGWLRTVAWVRLLASRVVGFSDFLEIAQQGSFGHS